MISINKKKKEQQAKSRKEGKIMKIQRKVIPALAILVSTNLACLAADPKTEHKQDTATRMQIQDKID